MLNSVAHYLLVKEKEFKKIFSIGRKVSKLVRCVPPITGHLTEEG